MANKRKRRFSSDSEQSSGKQSNKSQSIKKAEPIIEKEASLSSKRKVES